MALSTFGPRTFASSTFYALSHGFAETSEEASAPTSPAITSTPTVAGNTHWKDVKDILFPGEHGYDSPAANDNSSPLFAITFPIRKQAVFTFAEASSPRPLKVAGAPTANPESNNGVLLLLLGVGIGAFTLGRLSKGKKK